MSPYQHGEVFVTDDGAETDLDLGHYERFTGRSANKQTYYDGTHLPDIIAKERRGDFLGGTVQVFPMLPMRSRISSDQAMRTSISSWWKLAARWRH